jgi:hypothetical protein
MAGRYPFLDEEPVDQLEGQGAGDLDIDLEAMVMTTPDSHRESRVIALFQGSVVFGDFLILGTGRRHREARWATPDIRSNRVARESRVLEIR